MNSPSFLEQRARRLFCCARALGLGIAATALFASPASGGRTCHWVAPGMDGEWSDAANWRSEGGHSGVPGAEDEVVFADEGSAPMITINGAGAEVAAIRINQNPSEPIRIHGEGEVRFGAPREERPGILLENRAPGLVLDAAVELPRGFNLRNLSNAQITFNGPLRVRDLGRGNNDIRSGSYVFNAENDFSNTAFRIRSAEVVLNHDGALNRAEILFRENSTVTIGTDFIFPQGLILASDASLRIRAAAEGDSDLVLVAREVSTSEGGGTSLAFAENAEGFAGNLILLLTGNRSGEGVVDMEILTLENSVVLVDNELGRFSFGTPEGAPGRLIGHGKLVKRNSGDLYLFDQSSHTGGTYIEEGTVWLEASRHSRGALPDGGKVVFGSSAALQLNDFDQTLGALSSMDGASGARLLFGNGTLRCETTADAVFNGDVEGGGVFIKQGNGTQRISGGFSAKRLQVEAGTLILEGAVEVEDIEVLEGGTLVPAAATLGDVNVRGKLRLARNGASVFAGDVEFVDGAVLELAMDSSGLNFDGTGGALRFGRPVIVDLDGLQIQGNRFVVANLANIDFDPDATRHLVIGNPGVEGEFLVENDQLVFIVSP